MAHGIPARLTRRELRRFGLTVGGVFAALAMIAWWRGAVHSPRVMGGLAILLVAGGLVAPVALGPVYTGWMKLASLLSKVTTPLVLGVLFFLIFTPVGFLMRRFGRNPLVRPLKHDSYWVDREPGARQSVLEHPY